MPDDEQLTHTAIHYIELWTKAAYMQAARILENRQGQYERNFGRTEFVSIPGDTISWEADSHLFIMALHQLRSAASLLQESVPIQIADKIEVIIERFDCAVPDVKRIRNVLTHFYDYAKGIGRLYRNNSQSLLEIHLGSSFSLAPESGLAGTNIHKCIISANITPDLPRLEIEVFSASNAAFTLHRMLFETLF